MTVLEIAKDISEGLARAATAGEMDGEVVDLRHRVDRGLQPEHPDCFRSGGPGSLPAYYLPHPGSGG